MTIQQNRRWKFALFMGLIFVILSCNLPFDQETFAEDQSQDGAPVLALAVNMDGHSPLIHIFVGNSIADPWMLPAGNFYIEAKDAQGLVYPIGRLTIPQPGGEVALGEQMTAVGGMADPKRSQELVLIANAVTGIKSGVLSYLYQSSNGFSTQFFDPQYEWTPAAIRAVRENYDPVLAREDETLQAFMALEQRAGQVSGVNSCPGMCKPNAGILDSIVSFFVTMNVVDQNAVEDILAGSAAMSPEEKADAFPYIPSSLTGGAQSFDEMLQNLQNGDLDKYGPTRIRNFLMDEPTFVEALTEVRGTNRPLLQIAHEEGAVLIEKGAEMEVEIVKNVLETAFPGMQTGFNYADMVNALAEFLHTVYTDPLQGVAEFATAQVTSQITGQIKNGLLEMGYGDALASEMSDYLGGEIVGQFAEQDPDAEPEPETASQPQPEIEVSEEPSSPGTIASCIPQPGEYTLAIVDVNDRTSSSGEKRVCSAEGMLTNNSDREIMFAAYRVHNYGGHDYEKWATPGYQTVYPGDTLEFAEFYRCTGTHCGDGEWYYFTKVSILYNTPECLDLAFSYQDKVPESIIPVENPCSW